MKSSVVITSARKKPEKLLQKLYSTFVTMVSYKNYLSYEQKLPSFKCAAFLAQSHLHHAIVKIEYITNQSLFLSFSKSGKEGFRKIHNRINKDGCNVILCQQNKENG